jgi:hypothetical protein
MADWNVGERGKDENVGNMGKQNLLVGLRAISMVVMTRGLGTTPEQVESLVDVRKDVNNLEIHAYDPIECV